MLRTLPALRQQFGKVHVSFGEPMRLDDILQRHAPDVGAAREGRPAAVAARPPSTILRRAS